MFSFTETGRGPIFDGRGAKVFVQASNPVTSAVIAPLKTFTDAANEAGANFRPEVLGDQLARAHGSKLIPPVAALVKAARTERQAVSEAAVKMRRPYAALDMSRAGFWLGRILDMAAPAQIAFVRTAPLEALAAMVLPGNPAGLSDAVLADAIERFAIENFVAVQLTQGGFPRRATLSAITATGQDEAAARGQAESLIAEHHQRESLVADSERTLQALMIYIGAAFDIAPESAFQRVMAAL